MATQGIQVVPPINLVVANWKAPLKTVEVPRSSNGKWFSQCPMFFTEIIEECWANEGVKP